MTPSSERPRLRLISFKPVVKGSLRGFATIELPIGLTIADCPIHCSYGRSWVSLPARPRLDSDGRPVVENNRLQYNAVLRWATRDLADRWSAAVLSLVRSQYPGALDDGGAP